MVALDLVTEIQIAISIVSAASAAFSATAAFLIFKGNKLSRRAMEQWSRTLVQPRIFIHGSARDEREFIGRGPHKLLPAQITKPGIILENLGQGPALRGTLYVIDHLGERIPIRRIGTNHTFLRIPAGQVYHYPSYDSPEIEQYLSGQTRIRLQIEYFDINGVKYSLPLEEEHIELFADQSSPELPVSSTPRTPDRSISPG